MPVFRIHYASAGPQRPVHRDTTEWVCPRGYRVREARATFKQQHPSAAVATVLRIDH